MCWLWADPEGKTGAAEMAGLRLAGRRRARDCRVCRRSGFGTPELMSEMLPSNWTDWSPCYRVNGYSPSGLGSGHGSAR